MEKSKISNDNPKDPYSAHWAKKILYDNYGLKIRPKKNNIGVERMRLVRVKRNKFSASYPNKSKDKEKSKSKEKEMENLTKNYTTPNLRKESKEKKGNKNKEQNVNFLSGTIFPTDGKLKYEKKASAQSTFNFNKNFQDIMDLDKMSDLALNYVNSNKKPETINDKLNYIRTAYSRNNSKNSSNSRVKFYFDSNTKLKIRTFSDQKYNTSREEESGYGDNFSGNFNEYKKMHGNIGNIDQDLSGGFGIQFPLILASLKK